MAKATRLIRVTDATYKWLLEEAARLSEELGINVKLSDTANHHLKKCIEAADELRRKRETAAPVLPARMVKP